MFGKLKPKNVEVVSVEEYYDDLQNSPVYAGIPLDELNRDLVSPRPAQIEERNIHFVADNRTLIRVKNNLAPVKDQCGDEIYTVACYENASEVQPNDVYIAGEGEFTVVLTERIAAALNQKKIVEVKN